MNGETPPRLRLRLFPYHCYHRNYNNAMRSTPRDLWPRTGVLPAELGMRDQALCKSPGVRPVRLCGHVKRAKPCSSSVTVFMHGTLRLESFSPGRTAFLEDRQQLLVRLETMRTVSASAEQAQDCWMSIAPTGATKHSLANTWPLSSHGYESFMATFATTDSTPPSCPGLT